MKQKLLRHINKILRRNKTCSGEYSMGYLRAYQEMKEYLEQIKEDK